MLRSALRQTFVGARLRQARATRERFKANTAAFERRLVWILGSPRSGSSWLLRLLGEHDSVVPIDEPLIGWYLGPFLSDLPGGDASALDVESFTLRRVQRSKPSQFFAEPFSDVWIPSLARMMRERFHAHALRHEARTPCSQRMIVIKEPNGSQSADLIMRALPKSRLLFLLRDGRDVVDSELAANLEGSWVSREFPGLRGIGEERRLAFVTQSAYKWLWRTQVVQNAARLHRGPSLLLRYEDLLSDPGAHLAAVFRWMDLDTSQHNLELWIERNGFERMASGATGPNEFFRSAAPGAWLRNLTDQEQHVVQAILGAKLRELGYE